MVSTGTRDLSIIAMGYNSSGTLLSGNPKSSRGLYYVPAGHTWDGSWELAVDLLVEVNTSPIEVVAIAYLTFEEYGTGDCLETAIDDLLTSLSDYFESLRSREETLAPSAMEDLQILRRLLRERA